MGSLLFVIHLLFPCKAHIYHASSNGTFLWKLSYCSIAKLCLTLCKPMDCSTTGLSVPHWLQAHVHCISDAILPSHPMSPSSPFALNLSHHQSLFQWVSHFFASGGQSIGASASMNIQNWLPLGLTGLISLQSKGRSRVFSSTTIWNHQFFGAQPSVWSNSHICTWLLETP